MIQIKDIDDCKPSKGRVNIYWLGGAGFLFNFDNGRRICIDPYLSDSVERLFGFKRLIHSPISPEQLKFDFLLITHEHGDHLDIDVFETLVKNNPSSKVLAAKGCGDFISKYTDDYIVVTPYQTNNLDGIDVETVGADHGELSPDAVGFMLRFGDRKLYFTGDTSLNYELMDHAVKQQPEIVIPCINGAYGNMNEHESADLVSKCNAKYVIGSHYGMFNEHGGDIDKFARNVKCLCVDVKLEVLLPGCGIQI